MPNLLKSCRDSDAVTQADHEGQTSDSGLSNFTSNASLKERHSSQNIESFEQLHDGGAETLRSSVVRKFDFRLVPAMFLAYLFFFLDKSNFALARINGLETDLDLVGNQFNTSLAMFFILNMLFNIPGNLAVRRVGGAIWLPCLVIAWGLVTVSAGFITNFAGLCITRVFLGLAESSFLGGVLIYLGFFYTADELVLRVGLFYSSTALAGFLGGLMGSGLAQIRVPGFNGWPWIFFIEGALTVITGAGLLLFLPHTPGDAKFLTPAEKSFAVERMQTQGGASKDPLNWDTVKSAVLNVVTITIAVASFFSIEAVMSFSMFLPTLISAMGFKKLEASLMTAPPNLAALLFTIGMCYWSQRSGKAALPLNICSAIGALGYMFLMIGAKVGPPPVFLNVRLQYAGCFLVAMSVNATPPLALTWLSVNASPHYVRAIALGFVLSIGNSAAFLASFTYIKTEGPQYIKGHAINFGCLVGLLMVGFVLPLYMKVENRKRERGERDYRLDVRHRNGLSEEEHEFRLGWMHPGFRFKM